MIVHKAYYKCYVTRFGLVYFHSPVRTSFGALKGGFVYIKFRVMSVIEIVCIHMILLYEVQILIQLY